MLLASNLNTTIQVWEGGANVWCSVKQLSPLRRGAAWSCGALTSTPPSIKHSTIALKSLPINTKRRSQTPVPNACPLKTVWCMDQGGVEIADNRAASGGCVCVRERVRGRVCVRECVCGSLSLTHTHTHSLSHIQDGVEISDNSAASGGGLVIPKFSPTLPRVLCDCPAVQLVDEGLTRGGKRLRAGRMPPVVPLPTPLGLPQGPRHAPTVGSWAATVSYEQGTPVREGKGRSESGSLLSLSLSLSLSHTHPLTLSLSHTHPLTLSLSHTPSLSISLSLSLTGSWRRREQ